MSEPVQFFDGRVMVHGGDCISVMASLPEASVDSVVCDPPYGLEFMGKDWDSFTGAGMSRPGIGKRDREWPSFTGTNRTRCKECGHLVGQGGSACRCDNPQPYNAALPRSVGFGAWCFTWAVECFRVLKPGGHLVAFSGTRTYHRMACAIEDAGFEIRDQIAWCYGSGFPKSLNVAKAIDAGGGRPEDIRRMTMAADYEPSGRGRVNYDHGGGSAMNGTPGAWEPKSDAAKEWHGWGTAIKPAWEPICLARKPLIGTVVQNVLTHGTGALNIDGCRIESEGGKPRLGEASQERRYTNNGGTNFAALPGPRGGDPNGRFPANLIHDGSDDVLAAFPDTASGEPGIKRGGNNGAAYHAESRPPGTQMGGFGDAGSAARFFYTAKADSDDRLGSKHPTVKPVDLMQWLVRLVTPKGGVTLDPFAGTGTTGEAAWREGMRAILIEREPEYQADIARRMELVLQPTKRRAVAKTKNKITSDAGPLFGGGA